MNRQLRERLAALHVEMDEAVAERHVAAVATELRDPRSPSPRPRRVRAGALFAATALLLLPGAAFASEGAVPGDLLYPIKRITERVLLVVDPNIATEHRIEEVEAAIDRAAPFEEVSERLTDANASVRDTDVPADLLARLDVVRDRVAAEYDRTGDAPGADQDAEGSQTDRQPRDDTRSDELQSTPASTSTSTSVAPRTDEQLEPTSTTLPDNQDDRPPADAPPTTVPRGDRDDPPRDG